MRLTDSEKSNLKKRKRKLTDTDPNKLKKGQRIIYWMSRDQRVQDNWALIYAISWAEYKHLELAVVFTLTDGFMDAPVRHYAFMLAGLQEVESELAKLDIPFILLTGNPANTLIKFCEEENVGMVITDYSPLKISRDWKSSLIENIEAKKLEIAFQEVDTHNIIPIWETSDKQEYAARTIRPKIQKLLPTWLTDIPQIKKVNVPKWSGTKKYFPKNTDIDWKKTIESLNPDSKIGIVDWLSPGTQAAKKTLTEFITHKLEKYDKLRNKPTEKYLSNMSPYFHFGQISPQRVAFEISNLSKQDDNTKAYLEEMIVRRELADNYCHYNKNYDNFEGFPDWAKKTLNEHRNDKREYLYSLSKLEHGETHDPLWNAAQIEMVNTGKMHGYVRMYWAKKILEWTESPEQAQAFAIQLNDKFELDGRDPNGYTNIAWSIGGVHDHGWTERDIFGKIRYMSLASTGKKFNSKKYINTHLNLTLTKI